MTDLPPAGRAAADLPTLTDGVVRLRAWRDEDVAAGVAGQDEEIRRWAGREAPATVEEQRRLVREWQAAWRADRSVVAFVVEVDGAMVGHVEVRGAADGGGTLTWTLLRGRRGQGYATRAVRVLVDWALTESAQGGLGLQRVEARLDVRHDASHRVATRAGLHREGVQRVVPGMGDRADTTEYAVLARLATDPPLTEPESFRALLNSFLPRKRAISQMMMRDARARVLLCQLTYKRDWDLPGGVVEVGESPQRAVAREVSEELGLEVPVGDLLLTDWLPAWSGWDDALCLVFDGGQHDAGIVAGIVRQTREIRSAAFCTTEEVRERCTDFTAGRISRALANLGATGGYTERGGTGA